MSHITCQNGLVDRRKPMEELSFAEYLRKEMGLDDYQISKVQELLASFEQTEDMSAATDGVEICPKCGDSPSESRQERLCRERQAGVQMRIMRKEVHI